MKWILGFYMGIQKDNYKKHVARNYKGLGLYIGICRV